MTSFTPKTKTVAATVAALAALAGAALAQGATPRETTDSSLETSVVRLGELPNFWADNCPIALDTATAWAQGDDGEAGALHDEGFKLGVRELLRSYGGDTGVSVALRFRSPSGASTDLNRREELAGHAGYAANFAVPGSPSVRAYTVRTAGSTTVHVAFTRGAVEYGLAVEAAPGTDINTLQRTLATAVRRVASER